jgi:ribosome-binding protein aMBF1 (putative translation factor)
MWNATGICIKRRSAIGRAIAGSNEGPRPIPRISEARRRALQDLGDKVRSRREQLGLSQVELADRIGTTQPRISQIERGATMQLSVLMLFRIAEALDRELSISLTPL